MTDHLLRTHAPIATKAWELIDAEARDRLAPLLAARRIADWNGPLGWGFNSVPLGRTDSLDAPPTGAAAAGVHMRRRRVLPLAEIRVPFTVSRDELDDIQRGTPDPDLDDLARATGEIARIETRAVFHGWPAAGIGGIGESSSYPSSELGTDCGTYAATVAVEVSRLRRNGIEGPYDLVIGSAGYTRILESTEHGGYLLLDHLGRILGGSVIWAPGVDGAFVLAQGEGNFVIDCGQDISIGYSHHDADAVHLYLEESFTFRVLEPDAIITLT